MKKFYTFILFAACIVLGCGMAPESWAQSPKSEFRATWIATVANIDWPSSKVTTSGNSTQIKKQKDQLITILDALQAGNINAVCLQVRPTSDAFYPSALSPWSEYLTGTRGMDPGYDPLAFAIEEAHKRGIELHAWFNPFRYERSSTHVFGNVDIRANHPDWIIKYDNGSFSGTILDPGLPEVRHYLKQVMGELIANYDIDGVLADDYFYPYGGTTTEDATSKAKYKPSGMSDGDWRRQNVNQTIEGLYDTIQAVKPWVRFGMAPFGIWTTKSAVATANGISLPSGITGSDAYNQLFCDPVAWIKNGYIDYISPQIYWPTTSSGQNYTKLCQWWGQQVCKHFSDQLPGGKKVHLFVSHNDYSDWVTAEEEGLQVDANRQYCPYEAPGSIFYNTTNYRSKGLVTALKKSKFQQKALPPAMSWKAHTTFKLPYNVTLTGSVLSWTHPSNKAERFTVYVFPKGMDAEYAMNTSDYLYGIIYGKQVDLASLGDLSDKTIAVRVLDRYGNEHAYAMYNAAGTDPEPAPEGDLSRVELWRKTADETGFMSTDANRSIAYYDGHLYVADGLNSKYYILNASDGALEKTVNLPSKYHQWHNLRITNDGKMLLGNSGTGANTQSIYTNTLGGDSPELEATYTNNGFGRSDYFYLYLPFDGITAGATITMLSNTSSSFLYAALGQDGQMSWWSNIYSDSSLPTGISAKAIMRYGGSTIWASVAGAPPTLYYYIMSVHVADSWTGSTVPPSVNASGLLNFMLGGREYILLPADVQGSIATYDITEGLSKAAELLTRTNPLGDNPNATYTVDFASWIDGNDAYVYFLAPNNGIAAFKYTFTPKVTTVENVEQPAQISKRLTSDGLVIVVKEQGRERIYTPTGLRVQ